jgi:ankyrin repeat protein
MSADAFRMAAYEGRLDSVRSAVESGMDVNGVDPNQSLTALHMAAYNGHTETVEYLIEHGATVDSRDAEGKTPLIHACTGPFAKSVEALLDAGADVNARETTEGFTPLMMAAGLGEQEVVQVLLEHKADKTLLDADQESASDHARNSGHTAIVELLK